MECFILAIEIIGTATAAAAIFAGWAAVTAKGMVDLERNRDQTSAKEQQLRQARLVVVDVVTSPLHSITDETIEAMRTDTSAVPLEEDTPIAGVDVMATVLNAGREPIRDLMVKVVMGPSTFGPIGLGPMHPDAKFWVAPRMFSGSDTARVDLYCRFRDAQGQVWQVHNHGDGPELLEPVDLEQWRRAAGTFDAEAMSRAERGLVSDGRSFDGIDRLRQGNALPVERWVHSALVPKPGEHIPVDDSRWPWWMDQAGWADQAT